MNNATYIAISLFIMAGITYLTRALPILIFRKKIKNRFVQSFLFYMPYAVLAAMTFPAIFTATGNVISSVAGTIAALILSFVSGNLFLVPLGTAAVALIVNLFIR